MHVYVIYIAIHSHESCMYTCTSPPALYSHTVHVGFNKTEIEVSPGKIVDIGIRLTGKLDQNETLGVTLEQERDPNTDGTYACMIVTCMIL